MAEGRRGQRADQAVAESLPHLCEVLVRWVWQGSPQLRGELSSGGQGLYSGQVRARGHGNRDDNASGPDRSEGAGPGVS